MKKPTTTYICQQCGATSPKWLGKCPSCGNWNTYTEEIVQTNTRFSGGGVLRPSTREVPTTSSSLMKVEISSSRKVSQTMSL